MRLTFKEQDAIKRSFNVCLEGIPFELYLFGSRTDDNKKGGDIDLLLFVPPTAKDYVVDLKNKIRIKIFENIPEQRIDITVTAKEELSSDEFLRSAMKNAILLDASVKN